jgi:SH3 domain-containing YSC84-like protein 1
MGYRYHDVPRGRQRRVATGRSGDGLCVVDATMQAEILLYSRARGLFAGISLKGSTLRPDNDANRNLYGRKLDAKEIVLGDAVPAPPSESSLLTT